MPKKNFCKTNYNSRNNIFDIGYFTEDRLQFVTIYCIMQKREDYNSNGKYSCDKHCRTLEQGFCRHSLCYRDTFQHIQEHLGNFTVKQSNS